MEPDRNLLQVPSRPSNLQFVSAASENEVEVEGYGEGEDISDLGRVEHCSGQRLILRHCDRSVLDRSYSCMEATLMP